MTQRPCPVCGAAPAHPCRNAYGRELLHRHQLRDAPAGADVEMSPRLHQRIEEVARAAGVSACVALEWAIRKALSGSRWRSPPAECMTAHKRLSEAARRDDTQHQTRIVIPS